jgi:DNA-binding CsgD family transcriptional regulator
MKIYSSQYLTISFEEKNSRFIQFWKHSPKNISEFKLEMLAYIALYKKHQPHQSLWLQENFSLLLDEAAHLWIEVNINKPAKEYGNKKLAFVVSHDVLIHIDVINSFKENNSCISPKHFASESEASTWLNEDKIVTQNSHKMSVEFEGVDENGYGIIKFKSPSTEITKTFDSIKKMIETHEFIEKNLKKYILLTKREKQIIHIYAKIHNQNEIAEQLFISLHTMRTHWKNIKNKLQIHSGEELLLFANAFDIIHSKE